MSERIFRFSVGDRVTPACVESVLYGEIGLVDEQFVSDGKVVINVKFDNRKSLIGFRDYDLRLVEPAPAVNECLTVDNVNHPAHYNQGGIECIEAIKAATGSGFVKYCTGNVIKYLWRYDNKGGLEDLKKAAWYLDRAIKEMEVSGE
jgi:hypothetical protein